LKLAERAGDGLSFHRQSHGIVVVRSPPSQLLQLDVEC